MREGTELTTTDLGPRFLLNYVARETAPYLLPGGSAVDLAQVSGIRRWGESETAMYIPGMTMAVDLSKQEHEELFAAWMAFQSKRKSEDI